MIIRLRNHSMLLLFALVLWTGAAWAKDFEKHWGAVTNARFYEYEFSLDSSFSEKGLVKQGRADEPSLKIEMSPGAYYFHVRAVSEPGEPGPWSSAEHVFVEGGGARFRNPVAGTTIEVPNEETTIRFEWDSVDGAQDYELQIKNGQSKFSKNVISQGPSANVEGLKPGDWTAVVVARRRGEFLSKSSPLNFKVEFKALPRPHFLQPQEEDLITAFETSRVRWVRFAPGNKSEVIVRRLDQGPYVVSRETLYKSYSTFAPALPPGRYKITVRDFIKDSEQSVDASVTVYVKEDPLGSHLQTLGGNLRIIDTINMGWNAFSNDGNYPGFLKSSVAHEPEIRIDQKIWHNYGGEAVIAGLMNSPQILTKNQFGQINTEGLSGHYGETGFHFGPTYYWGGLGPTKPVVFKALVGWTEMKYIFFSGPDFSQPNNNNFSEEHFKLVDVRFGADLHWGGWNSAWELLASSYVGFPVWAWGPGISTGLPKFIPTFDLRAGFRRRLSQEFKLNVGMALHLENLQVNQDVAGLSVERSMAIWGPYFGIDLDF